MARLKKSKPNKNNDYKKQLDAQLRNIEHHLDHYITITDAMAIAHDADPANKAVHRIAAEKEKANIETPFSFTILDELIEELEKSDNKESYEAIAVKYADILAESTNMHALIKVTNFCLKEQRKSSTNFNLATMQLSKENLGRAFDRIKGALEQLNITPTMHVLNKLMLKNTDAQKIYELTKKIMPKTDTPGEDPCANLRTELHKEIANMQNAGVGSKARLAQNRKADKEQQKRVTSWQKEFSNVYDPANKKAELEIQSLPKTMKAAAEQQHRLAYHNTKDFSLEENAWETDENRLEEYEKGVFTNLWEIKTAIFKETTDEAGVICDEIDRWSDETKKNFKNKFFGEEEAKMLIASENHSRLNKMLDPTQAQKRPLASTLKSLNDNFDMRKEYAKAMQNIKNTGAPQLQSAPKTEQIEPPVAKASLG